MSTEDGRYQEDLKAPALTAIARQQEVIRRAEGKVREERAKLAELVYAATTKAADNPIPYGRVEHVARLLGVKRDRVAKIRAAVRNNRSKPAEACPEPDGSTDSSLSTAA
ncbi:hypothetical protein [Streptomyces hokutonensis]|uniref:Uncharacterized protein n=1 Tax=Streptomyces hokutonensis TaxID=1306990 RepID=A0ABW6LUS6_9ACTN